MIVGETNNVWETWEMGESVLKWTPNIGWRDSEMEGTGSRKCLRSL